MKILHVFSIALLTSGTALAQQNTIFKSHLQNTRQRQIAQMLLSQDLGTAQKSTGVRKRLIASSDYSSGIITDTTKYFYSNNYQTSKFDFNQVNFDNSSYNPVDYPAFSFNSALIPSGSYTIAAKCDSMKTWLDDGSGSGLALYEDQHNGYINNNVLSDHKDLVYYSGDVYSKHFINSYDAQGHLITSIEQTYDTTAHTWDTVSKKRISYNAQGLSQKDTVFQYSAGTWVATTAYDYTYDANGNLTQINDVEFNGANWAMAAQYKNTYINNRLKTFTYLEDTSSGGTGQFGPVTVDSFAYTGNSSFYTFWQENYVISATSSVPILLATRTLNAQGLPDTMNLSANTSGTSLSPLEKVTIIYDADGNPLTSDYQDLSGGGQGGTAKYYYETFNDASSVANVTAGKSFTIFPNPAQNVLNIRQAGSVNISSIRIVNTLGQNVITAHQNTNQIDISSLQPGVYWISIADDKGQGIYTQSFIKQ